MSRLAADQARNDARMKRIEERLDATETVLATQLGLSLSSLPEDEAIATLQPIAQEVAEPWSGNGIIYRPGDIVSYNGAVYMVRTGKGHTSQPSWSPDVAHSEFALVVEAPKADDGISEEDIFDWTQPQPGIFDGYPYGALVTYDGKVWRNTYEAGLNAWEPSYPGTFWEELITK